MKKQNSILTVSKRLVLGGAILATLSSSAFAGQGGLILGYTSADIDGTSANGVTIGYAGYFGETYKQSIGLSIDYLGENNDGNEEKGNMGNLYYTLGYEVLPDTVAYGTVGFGFQALGSSTYASGLSTGIGMQYNMTKNIIIDASYKNFDLSYQDLDYDVKTTNISLVFKY